MRKSKVDFKIKKVPDTKVFPSLLVAKSKNLGFSLKQKVAILSMAFLVLQSVSLSFTGKAIAAPGDASLNITVNIHYTNGGTAPASAFQIDVSQGGFPVGHTNGNGNVLIDGTQPYSSSSDSGNPSGYTVEFGLGCSNNNAPGSETSTACIVTITDQQVFMTVTDNVVNTGGGTKNSSNFTDTVTGTNVSDLSFPGTSEGQFVTLSAGTYNVAASTDSNYINSYNSDCSGPAVNGQSFNCIITNTFIAPTATSTLTVDLNNVGSGSATFGDFNLTVTDATSTLFSDPAADTQNYTLNVGDNYSVTEATTSSSSDYSIGLGSGCRGTVASTSPITCGITNTFVAPSPTPTSTPSPTPGSTDDLQITKTVDNQTPTVGNNVTYTLVATNNGPDDATNVVATDTLPSDLSFVSSTATVGSYNAGSGLWTIGSLPDGSSATSTIVATVNDNNGGDPIVNSVIIGGDQTDTNPDNNTSSVDINPTPACQGEDCVPTTGTGTLIVINSVHNDYGDTHIASDFTANVTGTNVSHPSFSTAEDPGTTVTLDPGAYTVGVMGPNGYATIYDSGCHGTIAAGQTITCNLNSDDQPGVLLITTSVDNTNGGSNQPSDFTVDVTATNPSQSSFQGSTTPVEIFVNPGTYSVDEADSLGYDKTLDPSCSGSIDFAQVITCNIANVFPSDGVGNPTTGTLIINKITNPDTDTTTQFPFSVVGSATSTNFSLSGGGTETFDNFPVGNYNIIEASTTGWTLNNTNCVYSDDQEIGSTIDNGEAITVDAGDTVTCTFTNNLNDPGTDDGGADLAITKTVDDSNPNQNSDVNYTLVVTDNGPDDANGVVVNDVLPSGLTYVSATSTVGSYDQVTGLWAVGDLSNGQSATTTITATIDPDTFGQTITNTATVSGDQSDPNSDNNTASVGLTVGQEDEGGGCTEDCSSTSTPDLIISNETITAVTTTSVVVTWITNHPATSRVVYDTVSHPNVSNSNCLSPDSTSFDCYGYAFTTNETDDSPKIINHSVLITGLTPNTIYFFRAVSHGSPEVTGPEINADTASNSGGSSGSGGGFCLGICSTSSGSGSGVSSGGGGSSNGPLVLAPTPTPSGGQPQVLGASTGNPSTGGLAMTTAPGQVLGASTSLPRTGMPPVVELLMLLAVGYVLNRKLKLV